MYYSISKFIYTSKCQYVQNNISLETLALFLAPYIKRTLATDLSKMFIYADLFIIQQQHKRIKR